jgi:hypothetical protein
MHPLEEKFLTAELGTNSGFFVIIVRNHKHAVWTTCRSSTVNPYPTKMENRVSS